MFVTGVFEADKSMLTWTLVLECKRNSLKLKFYDSRLNPKPRSASFGNPICSWSSCYQNENSLVKANLGRILRNS